MNEWIDKFHDAGFLQFATVLLLFFIAYEVATWRAEWKRLHKSKGKAENERLAEGKV